MYSELERSLKTFIINNYYERKNMRIHGFDTIAEFELLELVKSLIENGNIKGKQKDIINEFSKIFNVDIKKPKQIITDTKKRNIGSETLFLDKLKKSLLNYIIK